MLSLSACVSQEPKGNQGLLLTTRQRMAEKYVIRVCKNQPLDPAMTANGLSRNGLLRSFVVAS